MASRENTEKTGSAKRLFSGLFAGVIHTVGYVLLVVGISLLLATIGLLLANDFLALLKEDKPVTIELQEDTAAEDVAKMLKEEDVIKYPFLFKLITRLKKVDTFRSGTYEINGNMDYGQLLNTLRGGGKITRDIVTVTIPEGYNLKEICALLVEKDVVKEDVFWDVANNYDFAHFMLKDVPLGENRLEGYLFPDTYEFYTNSDNINDRGHTIDVINKMLNNFVKKYTQAMRNLTEANGKTIAEVVNVASLVEKEAKKEDERTIIAGVIYNRLNSNSFPYLQVDPTILYVIGHKEALTVEDLQIDSPYNTYNHEGLPPTAICNPGVACLMAAIQPEHHNYYYYVAKPDGSHIFSRTLDEHNRAVADVAAGKYD